MKTIHKKILGWFLATLIAPLICTWTVFTDPKYSEYLFWDKLGAAFIVGYILNIILAIFIAFIILVIWLINSED